MEVKAEQASPEIKKICFKNKSVVCECYSKGAVCTSVGVGGRGFLDPLRRDGLDVKPVSI